MVRQLGDSAFWILTVLASGRRHGYAIVQEVAARSDGVQLKWTTLYTVLDRLAREQLVEADGDEVVAGRTRRCTDDRASRKPVGVHQQKGLAQRGTPSRC